MVELHSFYIFFKTKSIYRGLYTDAAKRAVKNCVSKTLEEQKASQYNAEHSSLETMSPSSSSNLTSMKSNEFEYRNLHTSDSDQHLDTPDQLSYQYSRKQSSIDEDHATSGLEERTLKKKPSIYDNLEENQHKNYEKLLLGFLSGLTSFSKTICETNDLRPPEGLSVAHFNVCSTHQFKIHYFETITGYKLVCLTSLDSPNLSETLKCIYIDILTNLVISNPTYVVGTSINSSEFDNLVKKTIQSTF